MRDELRERQGDDHGEGEARDAALAFRCPVGLPRPSNEQPSRDDPHGERCERQRDEAECELDRLPPPVEVGQLALLVEKDDRGGHDDDLESDEVPRADRRRDSRPAAPLLAPVRELLPPHEDCEKDGEACQRPLQKRSDPEDPQPRVERRRILYEVDFPPTRDDVPDTEVLDQVEEGCAQDRVGPQARESAHTGQLPPFGPTEEEEEQQRVEGDEEDAVDEHEQGDDVLRRRRLNRLRNPRRCARRLRLPHHQDGRRLRTVRPCMEERVDVRHGERRASRNVHRRQQVVELAHRETDPDDPDGDEHDPPSRRPPLTSVLDAQHRSDGRHASSAHRMGTAPIAQIVTIGTIVVNKARSPSVGSTRVRRPAAASVPAWIRWVPSAAERHGPGGPAGLQNLCGVVAPRSVGSTPAPLR